MAPSDSELTLGQDARSSPTRAPAEGRLKRSLIVHLGVALTGHAEP
jgi:hypothetical protein